MKYFNLFQSIRRIDRILNVSLETKFCAYLGFTLEIFAVFID